MGQLFSDTGSYSAAESHESERIDFFALFFPSFRSENERIFEIFFVVMVSIGSL